MIIVCYRYHFQYYNILYICKIQDKMKNYSVTFATLLDLIYYPVAIIVLNL